DVVSGRFTPKPIREAPDSLEKASPDAYSQLVQVGLKLESHFCDVQDLEFTIERGQLWMLQTRPAKRTARAAVQIAVDLVHEGRISIEEAIGRIPGDGLLRLLHPSVDTNERRRIIGKGLPASPGAVSGMAIFDANEAIDRAERGETIILVRVETSTDDMDAIHQVAGVLTSRGGMTSHAALVARGLGKPCVTGCAELMIDERRRRCRVRNGNVTVSEGDSLTIDGTTGEVILGLVETHSAAPPASYQELMSWVDKRRALQVMANADNARAVEDANGNGADGIGLCCTEHMFLGRDHLSLVREMVLAYDQRTRRKVLDDLLPLQREDFRSMFAAMGTGSITIRLLDLPLHDLMPEDDGDFESIAQRLDTTVDHLSSRAGSLQAKNPILGHRGCRLGLTFPELYEVQVRALFEAVIESQYRAGVRILVPFVTAPDEMTRLRRRIEAISRQVTEERNTSLPTFEIGAMIESPRACIIADEIALVSDFLLFGTNDLTIGTHLLNRDDAGRFLNFYLEKGILDADPFVRLDEKGVGVLIDLAIKKVRDIRPGLPIGLAGAHANHPETVRWCCERSINYVTCAPHRLPMIRLAAAQAKLERTTD
ncbi:MAG: putative PEP-binding protein, partial [Myxococcota bacterium]|nr:putative PEP-binding protein [Myxococcota bacterium]